MANLAEGVSNQILLLAPNLLGESLAKQLNSAEPGLKVFLKKEELTRQPCIVIWSVESLDVPSSIQLELGHLQEYWKPSPVLLILPARARLKTSEFLQFDSPGLLQDPDLKTLSESIKTLIGGGRVVRLKDQSQDRWLYEQSPMGFGQWLLLSGLQQINNELQKLELFLNQTSQNTFKELLLYGRRRELKAAKVFLYWIWGPLQSPIDPLESNKVSYSISNTGIGATGYPLHEQFGTNISLSKRDSISVWEEIRSRLEKTIDQGIINRTGSLLAIEGLSSSRQKGLLLALIEQLDYLVKKLQDSESIDNPYKQTWIQVQAELREQSLRKMAGSYVRIPLKGELTTVGDHLLAITDLLASDDELPEAEQMLDPLLTNKPLVVEGQLLPPDDPRALIQLEMFFSNWLIRNAELICAEVMSACGEWPELRRYLLNPRLISTRELERLRNQLNSQMRWQSLIKRPIQLYESKRLFYRLREGTIEPVLMTEPRDEELRDLGWWQQQVALLVEVRDAIAPQIQAIIKKCGDLMVIVLTQVIGRAIGLVGRGIAQGMGRSLGRG